MDRSKDIALESINIKVLLVMAQQVATILHLLGIKGNWALVQILTLLQEGQRGCCVKPLLQKLIGIFYSSRDIFDVVDIYNN